VAQKHKGAKSGSLQLECQTNGISLFLLPTKRLE
jgi:hypothetical protein